MRLDVVDEAPGKEKLVSEFESREIPFIRKNSENQKQFSEKKNSVLLKEVRTIVKYVETPREWQDVAE
jgi:hypothetical protein